MFFGIVAVFEIAREAAVVAVERGRCTVGWRMRVRVGIAAEEELAHKRRYGGLCSLGLCTAPAHSDSDSDSSTAVVRPHDCDCLTQDTEDVLHLILPGVLEDRVSHMDLEDHGHDQSNSHWHWH